MPGPRRWLLAVLILTCVIVAPLHAPTYGFADELREMRGHSSDSDTDLIDDTLDGSRWAGIQFPDSSTLSASLFSRSFTGGMLPDPDEYSRRAGVGGGMPIDFSFHAVDGSRVFPLASGTFRVSQDFGCVPLDPGYALVDFCPPDRPSFHTGIDFAADEGSTIYASATGTVNFADIDRTSQSGNSITRIIHDGVNSGYVTEYYHWRTSFVEAGDYVIAGQPIGVVGNVGYSSGPHLHFGVFDASAGEYVEPLAWLQESESMPVAAGTGGVGGTDGVMQWASLIEASSIRHGIPAALVAAIITVESGGNPEAVSPVGAQGLMQIMPMHLERFGIPKNKWRDPATNIDAGSRLLAELLVAHGTLTNAVGAYFGHGCDVLGTCTGEYIAAVFAWYSHYIPIFEGVAVSADDFEFVLPEPGDPGESVANATPMPSPTPRVPTPEPAPSPTPEKPADDSVSEAPEAGSSPTPEPSPTPSPTAIPSPTPEPEPDASTDDDADDTDDSNQDEPRDPGVVEGHGSRWVADADAGVVLRMNPDDDVLIAMIEVGANPWAIAIGDTSVWVTNRDDDTVSRIDPELNEVVATIEVGDEPTGIVVTPEGVWVVHAGDSTVILIAPDSNEVVETRELDVVSCDLWLDEDKLMIAACDSDEEIEIERELDSTE